LDSENIFSLEGLSYILFKTDRHEEALDTLMSLVETTFYFPRAHALIGEILLDAGYFDKAAESFEVAVNMNNRDIKSRKRLVKIYGDLVPDSSKLNFHKLILDKLILGEIIVVTGLPRSGMSMVMQMLGKAGIELFYDDTRIADPFNTNGYFESSMVNQLSYDKTWLQNAIGKAIRIPCDLIEFLPENYNYKVIYIHRDFSEVLKSTLKMDRKMSDAFLNSFPVLLADSFSKYDSILQKTLKSRLDIDFLELEYNELIENPNHGAELLSKFIGKGEIENISSVINNELHQTKAVGK
jgi:tetratricopeptide (TPR) repeat protein